MRPDMKKKNENGTQTNIKLSTESARTSVNQMDAVKMRDTSRRLPALSVKNEVSGNQIREFKPT